MALVIADRIKETSTTTGTGALTLAGAMTGFKAFSAACAVGDTCYYTIQAVDGNQLPTGDWEVGLGTYSAASTLTRTTVLASSNANAAVTFSAGTKQVWIDLAAAQLAGISTPAWLTKTTSYTAFSGDNINADTSAGAFTITLPATPTVNDRIQIVDSAQCFDINPLTLNPNGGKVAASSQATVLRTAGQFLTLTYQGTTNGWVIAGGAAYSGTTWNLYDSLLPVLSTGRAILVGYSANSWASMRAVTPRSTGKFYFEFKIDAVVGSHTPMIGVGGSGATLSNYVGADALGWGITAAGSMYHSAASAAQAAYAPGDIVGIAIDFTASTGSIAFYKNNVANGSYTGLSLGAMFPMVSGTTQGGKGALRTQASQCTYSPPAGYTYWDA